MQSQSPTTTSSEGSDDPAALLRDLRQLPAGGADDPSVFQQVTDAITETNHAFLEMASAVKETHKAVTQLNDKLDAMDRDMTSKLGSLEPRFDTVETKIDVIESKIATIENMLNGIVPRGRLGLSASASAGALPSSAAPFMGATAPVAHQ